MDGDDGEGLRLSKRFSDTVKPGEVEYKTKAGTAWSHSYLNQKPWHPLSYPNQRRKWIAEQTHAQRQRRAEEVSREYAQEQEFFRQTALISKKEKEKVEMMKAVSFMYVRPPGYNVESAKAAEVADEMKRQGQGSTSQEQSVDGASTSMQPPELLAARDSVAEVKKKSRPKDVFGRALPTEEEFEVLKNAPRLETGVPGRSKPFGVEVRNVRCLRCGNYGHQSGDRECPLKDVIMPNEESRLKRDDPLTAIMAHTDPTEPLKWELKQKPGMSPPHGGFDQNDPNQQIVAEDIFDEYGGFLSGGDIPELLTNFSSKPRKRKSSKKTKHKRSSSPGDNLRTSQDDRFDSTDDEVRSKRGKRHEKKKRQQKEPSLNNSVDSKSYRCNRKSRIKNSCSSDDSESDQRLENRKNREKHLHSSKELDSEGQQNNRRNRKTNVHSYSSEDSEPDGLRNDKTSRKRGIKSRSTEVSDFRERRKIKCQKRKADSISSEDSDSEVQYMNRRSRKHNQHHHTSEDSDYVNQHRSQRSRKRDVHSHSSEDSDSEGLPKDRSRGRNLHSSKEKFAGHRQSKRDRRSYLSDDSSSGGHTRKENGRWKYSSDSDDSRTHWHHRSGETRGKCSSSQDDFDWHHKSWKSRPKHSDHQSCEYLRPRTDAKSKHHHHHHHY